MYRIVIPDEMQAMIEEVQAEFPLFNKPVDVLKLAMSNFYKQYKSDSTKLTLLNKSTKKVTIIKSTQTLKSILKKHRNSSAEFKHLNGEEIDKILYI